MRKILTINIKVCFLLLLFLVAACKNDDRIFEESPQARKDAQTELLQSMIQGSKTFKGIYFPKDNTYGGSLIYFSFGDDGSVQMSSGFDSDTKISNSTFDIRFNSSVELNFETFNHIAKLSDNNLPGLRGTGFEGSMNFIFMGDDGNGGIVLKDPRNLTTFTLVPIPESEFSMAQEESNKIFANSQHLISPTGSVFQQLQINDGSNVVNFDLNYDAVRLHATPQLRQDDGSVGTEINFGLAYTPDGLTVSPAIEYQGHTFKDFIYSPLGDNFIAKDKSATAVLGASSLPAYISNAYKSFIESSPVSVGYQPLAWGDNALTSKGFQQNVIDKLNENLSHTSIGAMTFVNFQFTFDFNNTGSGCDSYLLGSFKYNGATYRADFCYSATIAKDKKLFLTYSGPSNGNADLLKTEFKPLLDFFASQKGLVVTNEGSFTASNVNYSNQSSTITNLDDPSERVYVLRFN